MDSNILKQDKVDKNFLIGWESDVIYENDTIFNFWSHKFINEEIEKRDFKITG